MGSSNKKTNEIVLQLIKVISIDKHDIKKFSIIDRELTIDPPPRTMFVVYLILCSFQKKMIENMLGLWAFKICYHLKISIFVQFYCLFLYTLGNMTMRLHSYTHKKMHI